MQFRYLKWPEKLLVFMKLLFDECVPKKLKRAIAEYEALTVSEMSWRVVKNGKLPMSLFGCDLSKLALLLSITNLWLNLSQHCSVVGTVRAQRLSHFSCLATASDGAG